MEGKPRRIEDALSSGDAVLVQVTKDPIGHKGARLTSQITLAGRYLVLTFRQGFPQKRFCRFWPRRSPKSHGPYCAPPS